MGLDGGLVVVAIDCIVGSVNATVGVARDLSLASSTAARADGGGSGGGSGTGTATGTTPGQPKPPGALTKEPPTAGAKAATQAGPMSHHAHPPPPPPPATAEQAQSVSQDPQVV